ncbi:hypothetical protein HDU92_004309 [Lobulomyces angularis]|nr:hypothetical protein HDU92_004309 [Lobulomyces angularis]
MRKFSNEIEHNLKVDTTPRNSETSEYYFKFNMLPEDINRLSISSSQFFELLKEAPLFSKIPKIKNKLIVPIDLRSFDDFKEENLIYSLNICLTPIIIKRFKQNILNEFHFDRFLTSPESKARLQKFQEYLKLYKDIEVIVVIFDSDMSLNSSNNLFLNENVLILKEIIENVMLKNFLDLSIITNDVADINFNGLRNFFKCEKNNLIANKFITKINVAITEEQEKNLENLFNIDEKEESAVSKRSKKFIKQHKIGNGAFGNVYLALNVETNSLMAVKEVILSGNNLSESQNLNESTAEKKLIKAIKNEISILRCLKNENVVNYLDCEITKNYINLYLEYVSGGSIRSILHKYNSQFPLKLVQNLEYQIINGIGYLHSMNICHNDIKSDNILLDMKGVLKISDFGFSKQLDKSKNPYEVRESPGIKGTHRCIIIKYVKQVLKNVILDMAPEVLENIGYSAKVDIWSFGCVLLEMLKEKPWKNLNVKEIVSSLKRKEVPEISKDIPFNESFILEKCFLIDPLQRPTALELKKMFFFYGGIYPNNFNFEKFFLEVEESYKKKRQNKKSLEPNQIKKKNNLNSEYEYSLDSYSSLSVFSVNSSISTTPNSKSIINSASSIDNGFFPPINLNQSRINLKTSPSRNLLTKSASFQVTGERAVSSARDSRTRAQSCASDRLNSAGARLEQSLNSTRLSPIKRSSTIESHLTPSPPKEDPPNAITETMSPPLFTSTPPSITLERSPNFASSPRRQKYKIHSTSVPTAFTKVRPYLIFGQDSVLSSLTATDDLKNLRVTHLLSVSDAEPNFAVEKNGAFQVFQKVISDKVNSFFEDLKECCVYIDNALKCDTESVVFVYDKRGTYHSALVAIAYITWCGKRALDAFEEVRLLNPEIEKTLVNCISQLDDFVFNNLYHEEDDDPSTSFYEEHLRNRPSVEYIMKNLENFFPLSETKLEVENEKIIQSYNLVQNDSVATKIKWTKHMEDCIGKGAFAEVFLGLNLVTREIMAVKQVRLSKSPGEAERKHINAIKTEINLLRCLEHVNVVKYIDCEINNEYINLFLQYVSGGSIGSILKKYDKPFPEQVVMFLDFQIGNGLAYLHSKNIWHRDIKPDNILVDADGKVKISDYGVSKQTIDQDPYVSTDSVNKVGTFRYMAPEVVCNRGYSAKVDIWSFGCVMLEMITGQKPWSEFRRQEEISRALLEKRRPSISNKLSKAAQSLLDQCFNLDSKKRPKAVELLKSQFINQLKNPHLFDLTSFFSEAEENFKKKKKKDYEDENEIIIEGSLLNPFSNSGKNNSFTKDKSNFSFPESFNASIQ